MPAITDAMPMLNVLERRKGGGGGGKGGGGGSSGKGGGSGGGSSGGGSGSGGKSGGSGSSGSSGSGSGSGSSSKYFPGSHPPLSSAQKFGLGAGAGVGAGAAASYSFGGGRVQTLGSASPYAGRESGSGTRDSIYGTSRYGSGYPYGGAGSYVDYRPFPFVFWPVPIGNHYYCQTNCYDDHEGQRPGGNTSTALVKSSAPATNETYHLVGDAASVRAVLAAVIANCSAQDTTGQISTFDRAASHPEQAVQYYRASSFALTLDGYNNSAALASNAPKDNATALPSMADTPLPAYLNGTFLACLNATAAFALPLVDPPKRGLSKGAIAGIAVGATVGGILLLLALLFGVRAWRRRRAARASASAPAGGQFDTASGPRTPTSEHTAVHDGPHHASAPMTKESQMAQSGAMKMPEPRTS